MKNIISALVIGLFTIGALTVAAQDGTMMKSQDTMMKSQNTMMKKPMSHHRTRHHKKRHHRRHHTMTHKTM